MVSAQDLNTASWVCRGWRNFILGNEWLLSAVLDPDLGLRQRSEPSGTQYYRSLRQRLAMDLKMQNQAYQTPRVHYTIRDLNFVLALMESEKSTANGTSSIVATEFGVGDVPLSYNITEGKTADHGLDNIGRRLIVYYFTGQGLPVYVGNETLSPNMEIPLESRYAGFPSKHELTLISAHSSLRVLLLPKMFLSLHQCSLHDVHKFVSSSESLQPVE